MADTPRPAAATSHEGEHTPARISKVRKQPAAESIPGGAEVSAGSVSTTRQTQQQARGPRNLFLRRSDHGFGFTLRHFIVYPPDSCSLLPGERRSRHGPGGGRLDEPMDTIFVKHVREHSAAHSAGLATGDRLVCVNGASVTGLTYAQVVQLIQQSGEYLHLLVVPREDDLLQLYFSETAHNPYTNQRPWEIRQRDIYPDAPHLQQGMKSRSSSAMLTYQSPSSPAHRSLPRPGAASMSSSSLRRGSEGSLSRSCHYNGHHAPLSLQTPQRAASVERECSSSSRRESTSSLPPQVGTSDSSPRLSIASSNEADSVITRIKKSFEQKEEFLKRPNQPIWLPSSSASSASSTTSSTSSQNATASALIPREFYAHPQKFQKPLWPPQQNGLEDAEEHQESEPTSPRAQFLCGGPVTNNRPIPPPASDGTSLRPSSSSPLRSTVTPAPTTVAAQPRPFVSTLARITENQPTGGLSEAALHEQQLMLVSKRARQFESGRVEEDRTVLYRSELARLSAKKVVPDVAHRKQEFESKSRSLDAADPPPALMVSEISAPRSRSNSVTETWSSPSAQRDKRLSGSLTTAIMDDEKPRPARPTQLSLQNPVRPPSPPPASTAEESGHRLPAPGPPEAAHTPAPAPQGHTDGTNTQLVQMRRPRSHQKTIESDAERAVRRESYLKATWSERMHVDSDLSEDDHAHPEHPATSPPASGGQGEEQRPSIPRLRAIFAERNASISSPIPAGPPRPEGVLREGWLHCKLSLQDGKRATDRSWKQVWAVLRGTTLFLRKERRGASDSTGGHHGSGSGTPAHAGSSASLQTEETAVPLRGCLVDAAADYTKKKHVLRLHTPAGSQLLLQAEDPLDMAKWLQLLRPRAQEGAADDTASEPPLSPGPGSGSPPQVPRLSPQAAHKGIRKLTTSFRNRSPTGQSPVNKTRKPSQNEPLSSPKSKTWKGRVAKQLRRIQGNSPSSPTAPYPEGATIGVPLEDCPQSSYSEFVPWLVELCTGIVEERGLDIIGIYRVPGNTAAVAFLTEGVNKGFDDINLQDPRWNDVNVISSLLKSFFRKLPDSLFTSELYPHFIASDKFEDPNARFRRIRKLVRELPEHHYETLRCLMNHLNKVVQHSNSNKMEARNLAIVFGPTLVRTSDDNMVAMVTDMPHQCRIVESLISQADWFFSEEEDTDDMVTPSLPSSLLGEGNDAAADAANHSLLLNNIHKVEGYSSPSKEISAKDIVSSIISAANKKMQKAKSRRGLRLGSEDATDSRDEDKTTSGERNKSHGRDGAGDTSDATPPTSAGHDSGPPGMSVASSILSSVLFSGNIVKSIHAPQNPLPPQRSSEPTPARPSEPAKPSIDGATINTYAGLSANTQERIRRFELETRAMLSTKHYTETREATKQSLEHDWQQSKQELETGILDDFTDHITDARKKASDFESQGLVSKPPSGSTTASRPPLPPDRSTALAVLSSLRAIRRGNSAENLATISAEPVKPTSLFDTQKIAPNGTLKRLKTGKEQVAPLPSPSPLQGSLRCGSLDSLHDAFVQQEPRDRPRSDASDDGHDLLASLTSTFDKKMRSLMKSDTETVTEQEYTAEEEDTKQQSEVRPYRDPSLHRAKGRTLETSSPSPTQDAGSKVRVRDKDGNGSSRNSRKRDSIGSGSSPSLSKIEKEARNNSVIAPSSTSLFLARLKRKSAMHLQRGIKRRHTVGGTKDLAQLGWLPEETRPVVLSEAQQQEALRAWLQRGRLRSSSPELSPRTAAAASLLLLAAAELSQAMKSAGNKPKTSSTTPDLLTSLSIPLESHV